MAHNLYNRGRSEVIMIGSLGRCSHGHMADIPCVRCGARHPFRFLAHLWAYFR